MFAELQPGWKRLTKLSLSGFRKGFRGGQDLFLRSHDLDSAMNFLVPHLPKILVRIFIIVSPTICEFAFLFVSFLQKRYQEEVSMPHIRKMLEGVAYSEVTFQPVQNHPKPSF